MNIISFKAWNNPMKIEPSFSYEEGKQDRVSAALNKLLFVSMPLRVRKLITAGKHNSFSLFHSAKRSLNASIKRAFILILGSRQ